MDTLSVLAGVEPFAGTPRFEIRSRLGEGGMGVVYSAWDREREALVALKTLSRVDPASIYRLKHEFRSLADVRHPNLVVLHELFSIDGHWFFTMELVDGVPFNAFNRPDERLDISRLRSCLAQLVAGVRALHDVGLLHRDLKPPNVLVSTAGRVKILDFGLAREHRLDGRTDYSLDEGTVGTPVYMSPEQFTNDPITPASDWYSVGVMLYETLTGEMPFSGTLGEIITQKLTRPAPEPPGPPEAPADLAQLCSSLMERKPADRPESPEIGGQTSLGTETVEIRSAGRRIDLVGREQELQMLQAELDETEKGAPRVVRVVGPSGIGKSALVEHFVDGLAEHKKAVVLSGRCYERETLPFKALDAIVDSLTQYLRRQSPRDAAALLPRHIRALARLFPVLRRVDAVADAPEATTAAPDVHETRRRAFGALRELLGRIRDRTPLVVWIDDLQWGDSDSAVLLEEVLTGTEAPALLFVASYRPTDSNDVLGALETALVDSRQIDVEPLSETESQALARAWANRHEAIPDVQVSSIVREAEGNPYFVGELVHFLQSRAASGPSNGSGITDVSLGDVLNARIDALDDDMRRLLECISVAAHPIEQSVVLEAAGLSESRHDLTESLASLHLVRTGGSGRGEPVEVYHDRIRAGVLTRLDDTTTRRWHRRLAEALESSGRTDPEVLAFHYLEAGESSHGGLYALRAAEEAADALAFDRAAHLFGLALQHATLGSAERLRVQTRRARALADAGRGFEAAQAFLAAAQATQGTRALDLAQRAMEQYLISGHLSEGQSTCDEVLDQLGLHMPATPLKATVSTLFWRALLRLRGYNFELRDKSEVDSDTLLRIDACLSIAKGLGYIDPWRSRGLAARGVRMALNAGEPGRIVRLLVGEAALFAGRGDAGNAEHVLALADSVAEQLDTALDKGLVRACRGTCQLFLGQWKAAQSHCAEAARIFREECVSTSWEINTAEFFYCWAGYYRGRLSDLTVRVPELLDEAKHQGNLYASTTLRASYASYIWLVSDEPERVHAELQTAADQWHADTFVAQDYWMMQANAHLSLYQGDGESAWKRIRADWKSFQATLLTLAPVIRFQATQLRGGCALAAAQTDSENRRQLLAEGRRCMNRLLDLDFPGATGAGLALGAAACAVRGNPDASSRLLERAAEAFDRSDMPLFADAARLRAGIGEGERMSEQGVVAPDRLSRVLIPGFPVTRPESA